MRNALSLGTFDGLHSGHIKVLSLPDEYRKIAVTFDVPPKSVISGDSELIMTIEDKYSALKKISVDEIFALDFEKVRNISAEEFLEFLWQKFEPAIISCGFNYRFGKNGRGDRYLLENFCKEKDIKFVCCEPVKSGDEVVSSSKIRSLIKNGEIDAANKMLKFPFSFKTEVIKGDQRGRTIGFPTVNQRYPDELVKLKFGVYKTKVEFESEEYIGISNIGIRPTYESDYIISETYIKDFSGDLYGKKIRITPIKFLRIERKFSSLEELQRQIEIDLKII